MEQKALISVPVLGLNLRSLFFVYACVNLFALDVMQQWQFVVIGCLEIKVFFFFFWGIDEEIKTLTHSEYLIYICIGFSRDDMSACKHTCVLIETIQWVVIVTER